MSDSPYSPPPEGTPSQPPPPPSYGSWQGAPGYESQPAPPGMHVDPATGVLLPDGVELASVGRRIGAYFLAIPLAIVTLIIGYIVWGAIVWSKGTTPALQVLGMRCWQPAERTVPGWGRMALREIVGRIVEGLFFGIIGIISFIMFVSGKERKTIHDHIASTVVVYDPSKVLEPR